MANRKKSGFTLVELLVVISIIALLISILLPAVGETRRQARISSCTSNMAQHGQGSAIYAASNDETLPNAPDSPGGDLTAQYGPRGQIATRFATNERPLNGFAFGNNGLFTLPGNPSGIPSWNYIGDDFIHNNSGINMMYWVVLSEFMGDGTGAQAMQEVFLSPSDLQGKRDWDIFLDWIRTERQGEFPQTLSTNYTTPNMPGLTPARPISKGSYVYPTTMVCNPRIWTYSPRGTSNDDAQPVDPDLNGAFGAEQGFPTGGGFNFTDPSAANYYLKALRRNRASDVAFPSQKVAFYLMGPEHNPRTRGIFEQGVTATLSAVDGSARANRPFSDAAQPNRPESAGPVLTGIRFSNEPAGGFNFYYVLTNGGIKGRDL
jgi:prepilin-type N-terminal cleavage/methylation domain-containing protein